jgi:hypothetical protein
MLYGMSMKWKTAVDEVPDNLEPSAFEDWLWKREKLELNAAGQLAGLRNRSTFPSFTGLPADYAPDFYETSDIRPPRPRRHWCFLGEITEHFTLLMLQLQLQDVDGNTVPLIFYTERQGRELAPRQYQEGYTVAVLYARQHVFAHDGPGIRHEFPGTINVRPIVPFGLIHVRN